MSKIRWLFASVMAALAVGALPQLAHGQPLSGYVDMHTHPMAHLGFGGKLLHGAPDVGTLMPAIPDGSGCRKYVPTRSYAEALSGDNVTHGGFGLFDNTCGDSIRKEVIRTLESELGARVRHQEDGAQGYPTLNSWPAYNDITHQQMFIDWIRRAHQGGLRVMVALAVHNATLAAGVMGPGDINGDDVSSANIQITEMTRMVQRHRFMEIAKSASDLRRIVRSGKLAVVLGVEIDNIGNLHRDPSLDPYNVNESAQRTVRGALESLWDQGVRYVFPIHVIDNPFGGTAIYENVFNLSNYHQNGSFWNVRCAPPESRVNHQFVVDGFDAALAAAKAVKLGIDPFRNPPTPPTCAGHANGQGLTPLGVFALKEMMRMGLMVDVDHMSEKGVNAALSVAESFGYPLNSGHNGPRGGGGSENSRTDAQYRRIAALGGMVGLGHGGIASNFVRNFRRVRSLINNQPVAIGTDVNGLFALPAPDPAARVTSPLPRSKTGNRSWDINTDGFAHYGMLPDYVESWKAASRTDGLGLTATEMASFNATAEHFAQMWEATAQGAQQIHVPLGCFKDTPVRDLTGMTFQDRTMTVNTCLSRCAEGGYNYGGVQFGEFCFCGNDYGRYGSSTACNVPCSGNANEVCGGSFANNIYQLRGHQGCFQDFSDRDLSGLNYYDPNLTSSQCRSRCQQEGFAYASAQFGSSCFCGNDYGRYGTSNNCTMTCGGDSEQLCGGEWANTVFELRASLGCFADTTDRDLDGLWFSDANMTPNVCISRCESEGFAYAGVQFATNCFCGNTYSRFGASNQCTSSCPGNPAETCGGPWANSVYRLH